MMPAARHLETILAPAIEGLGFDLVDLLWVQEAGRNTLRVLIEKAAGSPTVADCTQVSRAVGPLLDVEVNIPGRYDLEVSSPGLNRPLRKPRDFERFQGKLIEVRTQAPIDGQKNYKGTLELFDGATLFLKEPDRLVKIPFDLVERSRLVAELPFASGKKKDHKKGVARGTD